eukprot:CAMPEP_0115217368 /NCGR_PEP_ID=MMETSP0270-20121206/25824_1 /TAXON_ID=71861 /ORGANISM="Scrippsiella trochoidea, Strain CCMP3099" /LENGTH=406 /DNA_ID=CAMNT_0002631247 /DNA_START=113 /DNA_END=1330 /DNA_ORIENTATION=+
MCTSAVREEDSARKQITAAAPNSMEDVSPGCIDSHEPMLLSQLVKFLGQRPRHTLLLSDLGALLPGPLRHAVKERGGLRHWLQKYSELFKVSGQAGKERVTLILGCSVEPGAASDNGRVDEGGAGVRGAAAAIASGDAKAEELEQKQREEENDNDSALQLRGLPYRATVPDVRNFLGHHKQFLKDERSVQLVLNRDGRSSGFARVQFITPMHAKAARDDLHMRMMEGGQEIVGGGQARYVEVFLFSERPNKLRFRKTTTGEEEQGVADTSTLATQDEAIIETEGAAVDIATREHVIAECREHMSSPGKGQLLLSMLGVALSQSSRMYLKKTDQGLKHFLVQHPEEFRVEGAKGREFITYIPVCGVGGQDNSDLPAGFAEESLKKGMQQQKQQQQKQQQQQQQQQQQ